MQSSSPVRGSVYNYTLLDTADYFALSHVLGHTVCVHYSLCNAALLRLGSQHAGNTLIRVTQS